MSASKDKILRKQQIEAGTDKRSIAEEKERKARRKSNITYAVVAVVLVVFFAFIFIYNSSWPSRHTTAVTIDGQDYTVAQLNYYYSNSYMTFYNNYYSYVNMGMFFDPSTSLKDQEYYDGMSWREYFLQTAVDDMTQIQMLNTEAAAAGFTLSDEDQAAYEAAIADMETNWEYLGYSSLKQYINLNYGKGVDEDLIRQELYRTYVASAYSQAVYNGFEYSASELDSYYAEHADELDLINYAYYIDFAGDADTQAIADAVNGTDLDAFNAYLAENMDETAAATEQIQAGGNLADAYSAWLLDSARQSGDAAAIDVDGTNYVVMFLNRDNNDYALTGFRHILILAEDTDGDGDYSQEEIDDAAAEADDLYAQWLAGDATEASFAELANLYSEDGGSNTNGGLYEDVYQGEMVEPINDWLFDAARQAGDTTVVSYNGPNYTGTHVVYFTGAADETFAQAQAENTLRNEAYNAWIEAAMSGYEAVTSHLGMCGQNH